MKTLLFLLLGFLFSSCNFNKTKIVEDAIDVNYIDGDLNLSSITENYKVTLLKAPTDDALFHEIDRVLFADNRIFVTCRRSNKVVAFNKEGEYISSTRNLIGNGPNEYVRVADATVDNDRKLIYLYCDAPYCLLILDYDLNFVKRVELNDLLLYEIASDSNYIYGITRDKSNRLHQKLIAISKDDYTISAPILEYELGVPGVSAMGKSMTSTKDGVLVCMLFDNVIYKISNKRIVEKYPLNLGKKGVDFSDIDETNANKFFKEYGSRHFMLQNMTASESCIMFGSNGVGTFVIDKNTDECKCYQWGNKNDAIPFLTSTIIPVEGLENVIVWKPSFDMTIRFAEHLKKENHWDGYNNETIDIFKNLTKDDNPLLVVWEMK